MFQPWKKIPHILTKATSIETISTEQSTVLSVIIRHNRGDKEGWSQARVGVNFIKGERSSHVCFQSFCHHVGLKINPSGLHFATINTQQFADNFVSSPSWSENKSSSLHYKTMNIQHIYVYEYTAVCWQLFCHHVGLKTQSIQSSLWNNEYTAVCLQLFCHHIGLKINPSSLHFEMMNIQQFADNCFVTMLVWKNNPSSLHFETMNIQQLADNCFVTMLVWK